MGRKTGPIYIYKAVCPKRAFEVCTLVRPTCGKDTSRSPFLSSQRSLGDGLCSISDLFGRHAYPKDASPFCIFIGRFFTILFGYILARKDLFPPAASRGASQVTMNIALPCLIFANIVPAFTPSNISALGPLFLLASVYIIIGFIFGWIIREVFHVPRNFWQGIVVMCGLSNWGNLPNSIVLSVTQKAPFDPSSDSELGVSFVAIFIVVYNITFWVLGAASSLAWDYAPGIPQGEEAERRISWKEKPIGGWISRVLLELRILNRKEEPCSHHVQNNGERDVEKSSRYMEGKEKELSYTTATQPVANECERPPNADPDIQLIRQTSRLSVHSFRSRRPSPGQACLPSFRDANVQDTRLLTPIAGEGTPVLSVSPSLDSINTPTVFDAHPASRLKLAIARVIKPIRVVVTPITITLAISLIVALVTPLKALFVDTISLGGPSWKGPDGLPPLAFVIDTCSFLGAIAVPLALVLLGASFARLHIPRPISRLPIAAMFAVSIAKMVILPAIGIFLVKAMIRGGLIAESAKAEIFVAILLSGTPAAVNQLIVSQLYSPDGNVDTLSAFLLVQYVLMFIMSSALTAIGLLMV